MDELIIIHFERTGGIAGLSLTHTVDMRSAGRDEADLIHDLVSRSGLTAGESREETASLYPDMFYYKIIIETSTGREEYQFPGQRVPDEAWPLIEYLTGRAKRG